MPSPNELLYRTTELLESFKDLGSADTFLNNTFFGVKKYFDGKFCQCDFYKARRLLAPLVKRGTLGRVVERPPVRTSYYDVPLIAPIRTINTGDLEDRYTGEHIYEGRSAEDRMADMVADDYIELRNAISRRIEWMTSQLLFEGVISYQLDDGSTETLEYGPPVEVTPALPWTDAASDPFKDLSDAADQILIDSGHVADTIVLGADALETFLRHPKVQLWLDIRRFGIALIEPEPRAGSAQFLGNLTKPYCAMYSYVEMAEQEGPAGGSNVLTPMLPPDVVLIGSSKSGSRTAYGSITQMESDGYTITVRGTELVPLTIYSTPEQKQTFRLASRPCMIPSDMESWRVIRPLEPVTEP